MFKLNNIELREYRCYKKASFSFSKEKTIFVGGNATGKTSVVEAIYYLAFAKSFRTSKDEEIIRLNGDADNAFFLKGQFNDGEIIEIGYDGTNKAIKKSGKKIRKLSQMVGYFMVALFYPDDLLLVKGEPRNRRSFIDSNLCQVDKEYLNALQVFKKVLKERNEYLKQLDGDINKINNNYLKALTRTYIETGEIIVKKRIEFIGEINEIASKIVGEISDKKDEINVSFIPNTNVDNFWKTFEERKMQDLYAKTTTWGPTRDDFKVEINGKSADGCASQGQIRTACLALKLAVVEYFKKVTENIIIILDDVFSELDEARQNKVLECISDNYQVFITTTNINLLTKNALENSEIIEVFRGEQDG